MAAGDLFTDEDRRTIDGAIREAEQRCRLEFSVFVGPAEGDTRAFATSLHNSLVAPSRSVMIMVDPAQRVLEVVTGGYARRTLDDGEVESAVRQMETAFAEDDFVGGLTSAISTLAVDALD